MDRRQFLASAALIATFPAVARGAPTGTNWVVRGSEGFDALSFLSPLSGDPFYARHYEAAVVAFAPRMDPDAMDALRTLKARASEANVLLSPFLDMRLSGGPDATIADLIHSLDNAETILRPPLEASPYWAGGGATGWDRFLRIAPIVRSILVAMQDAGFAEFRASIFEPKAAQRFPALRARLVGLNIVREVERFTGRTLNREVEVILLEFCKPHGVRVLGQTFLSPIDWSDASIIRTAGHELLHPPIPMDGPTATAALAVLNEDALIWRIIAEHDRSLGYSSLEGLFNEDLTSALDQLIAERLGYALDPAERWNSIDGGMHVLSAALYGLMRETGFSDAGGNAEQWLSRIIAQGRLSPTSLRASASRILGRPPDRLWTTPPR